LGNGTAPTDSPVPVVVTGLGAGSGVTAISAGDAFALARKSNGTLVSWGNNASGQLGDNTAPTDHATPVSVSGITGAEGVVDITPGFAFAAARTSSGSLYVWGRNASGQLGDGTTTQHNTPELLSTYTGASAVTAGGSHAVALKSHNVTA